MSVPDLTPQEGDGLQERKAKLSFKKGDKVFVRLERIEGGKRRVVELAVPGFQLALYNDPGFAMVEMWQKASRMIEQKVQSEKGCLLCRGDGGGTDLMPVADQEGNEIGRLCAWCSEVMQVHKNLDKGEARLLSIQEQQRHKVWRPIGGEG